MLSPHNSVDASFTSAAKPVAPPLQPHGHKWSKHQPLHFPTQRPNEHVVLLLRRYWTVIAGAVLKLVVLLGIPPIVLALVFLYSNFSLAPGTPLYVVTVGGFSLYYLFAFLSYFHDFVDYHLDIWVVTDQRIVSIEQQGLFRRVISELNLVQVQDVTSEIRGKVQTFLNYGNVHIQTAGERERFIFEQVPNPAEVAKVILQAHDQLRRRQEMEKIRQQEAFHQQLRAEATEKLKHAS